MTKIDAVGRCKLRSSHHELVRALRDAENDMRVVPRWWRLDKAMVAVEAKSGSGSLSIYSLPHVFMTSFVSLSKDCDGIAAEKKSDGAAD